MKKTLLSILFAATAFWHSTPVWADNTQHCLQLYYMKSYAQALPFCLLSAEEGNSQPQYVLGLMYADAQGVAEDKAEAIKWFTAASKQGYAAALYKLQKLENDSSDEVMARFMPKRRAANASGAIGHRSAAAQTASQHTLPTMQTPPVSVSPADTTEAAQAATAPLPTQTEAALQTKPEHAQISEAVVEPVAKLDDATLFAQYLAASELGDAHARFMLGLFYAEGRGVQQDDVQAAGLLRLAAADQADAQGLADAQFSLGLMYIEGRGVEQDEIQAVYWLSRAAEQGHLEAQHSLGLVYASSTNGMKNEADAVRWWLRAAEQKHPKAQHNLAIMYLKGLGTEASRDEAMRWFHREAEQGNPQAQFNLGRLYSEGKWLDKNGGDAANWYYLAGETWLKVGHKDKARQAVEKIRQLTSEFHLNVPNLFLADVLNKQIEETANL